jgi:chaperonin GroEL
MILTIHGENDALLAMLDGVEELITAVGPSLGPCGKTALHVYPGQYSEHTHSSSHGNTIIGFFDQASGIKYSAIDSIQKAVNHTQSFAGDATTSAAIVASSIFVEAVKLITSGNNSLAIRSGVCKALDVAETAVKTLARPIARPEETRQVAETALRGDTRHIDALMRALELAGDNGYIEIDVRSPSQLDGRTETSVQKADGIVVPGSIVGTEPRSVQSGPFDVIVITGEVLRSVTVDEVFRKYGPTGSFPILLLASTLNSAIKGENDNSSDNCRAIMEYANEKSLQVVAVVPTYLSDSDLINIASYAGTIVYREGERSAPPLGHVEMLGTRDDGKVFISGGQVESQIFKNHVRDLEKHSKTADDEYRKKLAYFVGKYFTLVAYEMSDTGERTRLLSNALSAVRNAQISGVVPGAGIALLTAANAMSHDRPGIEAERFGFEAVRRALSRPTYWIAKNAGKEPTSLIEEIQRRGGNTGFDARTGELADLMVAGIIDPTTCPLAVLKTAASAVSSLLNISAIIEVEREKDGGDDDDHGPMSVHERMGGGHRMRRR